MSTTTTSLPTDVGAIRAVAVDRAAGQSWAQIGQALGTSGEAARRTYERAISPYRGEATRQRNRILALDMDRLPASVVGRLAAVSDAAGLLESLREPRHREVLGEQAACIQADPETFVPWGSGASAEPAFRICRGCPVRGECVADALAAPLRVHGVWGGLSVRGRARVQKELEAIGFVFPTTSTSSADRSASPTAEAA